MANLLSRWSWLDEGVLPGLIAIIRTCWIWPWLGLVQMGLSPESPNAVLSLWLVTLVPLASFGLARWASQQPSRIAINALPAADNQERQPFLPRLLVGFTGIVAAIGIAWWQLYRGEFGLLNPDWLSQMGDSLIHWPEIYIPPAALLLVTGLFLWLRGLLDAGISLTHDSVWRVFVTGIIMMVLYLVSISLADVDRVNLLITSVLVMLAAGMSALAFSSIKITAGLDRALGFGVRQMNDAEGGELAALQSEAIPIVNRYWFVSVGGAIAILMALGILLTLVIAPEVLQAIVDVLWIIATFIGDLIFNILLFFAYIGAIIFFYLWQFIEPLIKRLMERFNLDPELMENFRQEPEATPEPSEIIERAPVPDEYRWLGLLVFSLITLIVFALVIRRLSKTDTELLDEDRESILSADLLQDQLNSLWNRLRGRFGRQNPDDPFLPLDGEETRRRIRAVYQSLLAIANDLGAPREAALTPVEYEERLVKLTVDSPGVAADDTGISVQNPTSSNRAPADSDSTDVLAVIHQFYGQRFSKQLDLITAGYVAARYGNVAPSIEVALKVEQAWAEIEHGMKREE